MNENPREALGNGAVGAAGLLLHIVVILEFATHMIRLRAEPWLAVSSHRLLYCIPELDDDGYTYLPSEAF
jgi:hypothetical protein